MAEMIKNVAIPGGLCAKKSPVLRLGFFDTFFTVK
jgi:hypothetical protein